MIFCRFYTILMHKWLSVSNPIIFLPYFVCIPLPDNYKSMHHPKYYLHGLFMIKPLRNVLANHLGSSYTEFILNGNANKSLCGTLLNVTGSLMVYRCNKCIIFWIFEALISAIAINDFNRDIHFVNANKCSISANKPWGTHYNGCQKGYDKGRFRWEVPFIIV